MRLGEVFERDGKQYIVTSFYTERGRPAAIVATEIPDGDTAIGLGRTYSAVHGQDEIARRGLVIPLSGYDGATQ